MSEFENAENYRVGKYQFELREDYEVALQEKKGVEYLHNQLDYGDINKVLNTYNELISKRIFYTPIGIEYVNKLRGLILSDGSVDTTKLLPLYVPSGRRKDSDRVEKYISRKYKDQMKGLDTSVKKLKSTNAFLGMLVAFLIAIIVAMFIITAKSDNPNILNYERVLQDRYATWAEDLAEKEEELREWERELELTDIEK